MAIAAAGSGKTFSLISRVTNLLDEGIAPENILLLTFTNKAANEMKERIVKYIGADGEKVTACTFHSFCANFLRQHSHLLKIPNNFNIMDGTDSLDAMSIAMQEFLDSSPRKYDFKDFPNKRQIFSIYSSAINNCQPFLDAIAESKYSQYEREISTIIENYIQYKLSRSLLDYDDLLLHTKTILEEFESVRKGMDEHYKYISCDEYQDTNILQDAILDLMSRDYCNLAVVGDDDQSIYKFRCANIENILTFEQRHPGCKKIVLYENYRSSQEILDLSNVVMKYKKEGIPKTLHGQFNKDKPRLIIVDDANAEAEFITKTILQRNKAGEKLNDMAVIIRGSMQSFTLEAMLNKYGIPFEKFGGIKFLEKSVIKDILAFLRISVNQKDELAIYRLVQLYPGIGMKTAKKLSEAVTEQGLDVLKTIYTRNKFHQYLVELFDTIQNLQSMAIGDQLDFLINQYYEKTVFNTIDLSSKSTLDKMEEKHKIKEQLEEAKLLIQMSEKYQTTSKFLEDLVLDAAKPQKDGDFLNITTIHSAKGLEYNTVFLMDVIENVTPKSREGTDEDREELRCMYVALTRAKRNLFVIVPKRYQMGGRGFEQSRFSHFINKDDILKKFHCTASKSEIAQLKESFNMFNSYRKFWS